MTMAPLLDQTFFAAWLGLMFANITIRKGKHLKTSFNTPLTPDRINSAPTCVLHELMYFISYESLRPEEHRELHEGHVVLIVPLLVEGECVCHQF